MTTTTTTTTPQTPPTTPPLPPHDKLPRDLDLLDMDLASLPSSPSPSILSPPLSPTHHTPTTTTSSPTTTTTLIQTLTSHPPLPPLHRAALSALGPVRFQRNLARLLTQYARNLRAEATTPAQRRLAREMRTKAFVVAGGVAEAFRGSSGSPWTTGYSPRGKRALVMASLQRHRHSFEDVPCPPEDDDREGWQHEGREDVDGDEEGGEEVDTSFLTSSTAFATLCDAYRAWLNTSTPAPAPTTPTKTPESPDARRARLAAAFAAADAERIPDVTEYDAHGTWQGAAYSSRPSSPPPPPTPTTPRRLRATMPRPRPRHRWWKSQWVLALAALLVTIWLGVAACWTLSMKTGVPLRTVLSVVGEWMGAGLAGCVVVYVAREHHHYLGEEGCDGEDDGEGGC
ncbi:hypothetical protein QBC39DRAFT_366681 [Podospora conica]|nr:hypothetical protein QBC39DRAFT_366681 [Schizothecium conicum]